MKNKHDKVTADMFEMSDTDILKWVEEHICEIRINATEVESYTIVYAMNGNYHKLVAPTVKEAVIKACTNL